MTKNKNTNRNSLWASGLSLVLCLAMLIGTTFAWFSDTVSNKGNKIQAGNLKVGFYVSDNESTTLPTIGSTNADTPKIGDWTDLKFSKTPVFTMGTVAKPAQPGDTLTKYVAIRNEGSIALKYFLDFMVDDGGLGDAVTFDFTAISPAGDTTTLTGSQLSEQKVNGSSSTLGEFTVYKMDLTFNQSAGNTYQGGTFSVDLNLTATQNKQGAIDALVKAKNASDFVNAAPNSTIVLQKNIVADADINLDYCNIDLNGYTLDLGGKTLKIENTTDIGTADIEGGTVKNGTIVVNTPSGTINMFGAYGTTAIDIQAVSNNSFHFFGTISGTISIASGRIVIEKGATASKIIVPNEAQKVFVENKGTLTNLTNNSSEAVDLVISEGGNTPTISGEVDKDNSNFNGGDGTADAPYEIANATQLSYVSSALNANYKLLNDIDLKNVNFAPIGAASRASSLVMGKCFSGVFDGNNKTISNMSFNVTSNDAAGLFSAVKGENAIVKNINIVGAKISGDNEIGAIAGLLTGGGIVENCTVDSTSTVTSVNVAGGIVGAGIGRNSTTLPTKLFAKIQNCTSSATINSQEKAGGIAGGFTYAKVQGEMSMNNCTNNGSVTGVYAGGICGYTVQSVFESCVNTGAITGTSDQTAGGISASSFQSTVKACRNDGAVTNVNGMAGGIAGYAQDIDKTNQIYNCVNNGKIAGTEAGGITGSFGLKTDLCTNNGDVVGTKYAGGIMGMCNNSITSNCVNNGNISGTNYVAGINGNSSYNTIKNCTNEGSITGTGDYIGGIAGWIVNGGRTSTDENARAAIQNSTNKGAIKGNNMVGGIVGSLRYPAYDFSNNTNQGNVEGVKDVGGVIGIYDTGMSVSKDINPLVTNCSNSANVKGKTNVGGFMGSTKLQTAGGDTIFTDCTTTAQSVTGETAVGAFVGLTLAKTVDTIFASSCTYAGVNDLPSVGTGSGGTNITKLP